jgi:SAM-dependent methyltransferase
MTQDIRTIAETFDERAEKYSKNEWHRVYAEQLVALTPLAPEQRVLDAGVGTGFAAIAIARRVGPSGYVLGVDVSPGMLLKARGAIDEAGIGNVELLQADATDLHLIASSSFDVVISASALLYMPVALALREWRRLLVADGVVGFSTMRTGSPPAGQRFRECVREECGLTLEDPSAELGSEDRCRTVLETAGFDRVTIVPGRVQLSSDDLAHAWESNVRSAAHAAVRGLSVADQEVLRERFELAMHEARLEDEASFGRVDALYAFARKT